MLTTQHQLLNPQQLFEKAHVHKGMHVADLGCGRTGHITFAVAQMLGEDGVVYAIDILKDVLEQVQRRAAIEQFHNIHTVWANVELVGSTAIPDQSLDVVFLINALSQMDNRHGALDEAMRLLKPKGRLLITDWKQTGVAISPALERLVDFHNIYSWATQRGFVLQEEFEPSKYLHGQVYFRHT